MPENKVLVERIRSVLANQKGIVEKKMFGGISFMLNGNLACGVLGDEMIVRVGPDGYEDAMLQPNTRTFDFSGKAMKGWITVKAEGCTKDSDIRAWVRRGTEYAATLPPK